MGNIWSWLQGKKTYIVCLVAILGYWYSFYLGDSTMHEAMGATETALIGMFLRHGISAPDSPHPSPK